MKKLLLFTFFIALKLTSYSQSIEVTYPNGGETFTANNQEFITWNDVLVAQVKIEYSTDNGGSWTFITNATSFSGTGFYQWDVPNVASSNCLIKISSTANTSINDISNAVFEIVAPSISLYYPNYAISFAVGSSEDISWYAPGVDFVDIEYSTNGGSSYTTIATGIDANLNSYTWDPIPNTPSTTCRVRIKQSSNNSIFDISDYDFTIGSPSLTVTDPNGGETYIVNTGEYIEWTTVGITDVNIEYSTNGGNTWTYIGNSTSSPWYWWDPIPNTPSTNCLIRVSDANNASINDISDAPFTIQGGTITLNYPNGNEIWAAGSVHEIWWTSPGITEANIYYSFDSMATWQPILLNFTNNTWFDWTVPNTPSTHCFVKVEDSSNPSVFDISNAQFTISAPTISISAPNGGETFQSGNTPYIQFDVLGVDSVFIEYSIDGGTNWTTIVSAFNVWDGYNYYQWLVPNTPSNNCLVRIKDLATGLISDVSDFTFAIVFGGLPPCTSGFYPNNNAASASRNPTLTWNNPSSSVLIDGFDLYFGTNATPPLYQAGIDFTYFDISGLSASTTYYWQIVPTSVNGAASGCIVNSFTTAAANQYNMDNQSETVCSGTFYDASGLTADYNINEDYTKTFYPSSVGQVLKFDFTAFESEQSWDLLKVYDGANTSASLIGTYSGVNGPGTIVATNAQGALTFTWSSDYAYQYLGWEAAISCVAQGTQAINLTSPNGGESWIGNTSHPITWTSQNVANVNLEYSIDSGLTWQSIATNIVNNGTYNWQVPLPASTHCFVRVISSNNPAVFDQSNAQFEIQFVPVYIDLLSPNTNQTFLVGTTTYISWQSMFVTNVNIEYSIDAGSNWINITSGYNTIDGYNYYNWTIPNNPSNLCLVRVSDASNSAVNDFSQTAFYIVGPNLEVTYPNGGETLGGNTNVYITWSGYLNSNYVKLEFSSNNGATWNTIASSVYHYNGINNNYYLWFVNNVNSTNCRIRVSEVVNSNIFDESNNVFTINANSSNITITQPNGGEVLSGGLTYSIQWNSSFVSGYYKILFSNDNGGTWDTLANNVYNSGYYNWLVPNTANSNCLIKVIDVNNPTIFDVSDATFSTAQTNPYINNVYPSGGQNFVVGNYTPITWNSAMVTLVDILFSSDGGNTYSTVVTNLNNINYYNWLVPNVISNNCIIKVRAAGNNSLSDSSAAEFSIVLGTPSISLVSPNGGEIFLQNTPNHVIQWTGTGIGNTIKLEYSLDAGANWTTIISSFASVNNVYYWFTPNVISNQCLVRVTSNSNQTLTDISDAEFTISSSTPQLTMLTPNGGEYLNQGYYYNITWNRNNIPLINLSYSDDNGGTWNSLLTNVNADSYYWNVPNISSTQCLMKVEKAGTGAPLFDNSDALFTIGPVIPNSNGIVIDSISPLPFCKLDTFYVYYTASGVYNAGNVFQVQLSDSVGNFTNAVLIGSLSSTTSGVVACVVPTSIGNGVAYRVRIQSSDLPSISNDNGFDIVVNSPQFDFAANELIKYLPDGAVTFYVIPQQGVTATYDWDFGDGGTSTQAQPTHNYSTIGKFDVNCTIIDGGCSVSVNKDLYIRVEQLFPGTQVSTNTTVDITDVTMLDSATALMTMKDGSCLRSFDGGNTWNVSSTGLIPGVDTLLSCDMYPNKWRVVGSNGLIRESADNGQTWTPMNSGVTQRMYGVATYDNNKSFAVGDAGVILNFDGTNWVQQNTGVTARFWDVAVDKSAATPTAYAVGSGGTIFKYDGSNWSPQNSGISGGLFGTTVLGNNVVYAVGGVTQGLILRTSDGGQNWVTVLNGVDVSFRSVTGIADTAWACAFDGIIYETRDGGASWVRYSVGDTYNNNSVIFKTSRGIVASNGGNALIFGPVDVGIKNKFYAPNQLMLYPNPTEGIVNFKGKFERSNHVQFTIKDINGKTVLTLPKQSLVQGELNYRVNVSNLGNGIYFVFADDGIQSFVKKLVISH
ncbi:MAG TPA: PKD domain-containing protein [Bacteroidia bacterium]|nr:PKD domain-containing protein [Bacteroidia bacterium]